MRADAGLMPSLVSETIRWATPVIHMRRTARKDCELAGKQIRAGDKVVMWYVSGNRDETAIDEPERFVVGRPEGAPSPVLRRGHPSLRRRPARRDADPDPVGRAAEA